jgi:Cadherin-like beta sandwich domain/Fibronectin type III domain
MHRNRHIFQLSPQRWGLLIGIVGWLFSTVLASALTIAWNPNPEADIAGYRVHYGTVSGTYTTTLDAGNVTTTEVTSLQSGTTYFFVVTAYNTYSIESLPSDEVSYTVPAQNNANLSSLVASAGTLTPAFAAATTAYTVSVPNATTSITLTPTLSDATATVRINGAVVASGSASAPVSLNVGANTIAAVVTAQNGTTRTYTLTVTRGANTNANLSSLVASAGTLTPAFTAATTAYAVSVPNATTSITLTPTLSDATATVRINGAVVASGSASAPVSLNVGANTIAAVVTAQNGTTRTYTLTVTRGANTNANLSSLVASAGTLTPAFTAATTAYTVSVPNATTSITLTPTLADATATVRINGAVVASGSASAPVSLNVGANTIAAVVTAQNGTTTKTYTLTVTRTSPDAIAPGLSVIAPVVGGTVVGSPGAERTVAGIASDNAGVTEVLVSLNGGPFAPAALKPGAIATAPVKWDLPVVPENGVNLLVAKALDAQGNTSALRTVRFRYVVARPHLAGNYAGLATPTGDSTNPARQVGLGRVSVLSTGAFTGRLTLGGTPMPVVFSGTFGNGGAARFGSSGATLFEIKRRDLPPLALSLDLSVGGLPADRVTGTLSENGTVVSAVTLDRSLYSAAKAPVAPKTNVPIALLDPATNRGAHTAVFQALTPEAQGMAASEFPQGDGWALMTVKPTGAVYVVGKLGDGQPFTYTNYLSKENVLPLYLMPYGGKGSVSGPVNFRDVPAQSDADGVGLMWFKPANPLDSAYRAGWQNGIAVDFFGSKFVSPVLTKKTILGNEPAPTAAEANAVLTLSDGGLSGVLSEQLSVDAMNRAARLGPLEGGATAQISMVTLYPNGFFAGRFLHPNDGKTTVANGVVLQKNQSAGGYFVGAAAAGSAVGAPRVSGAITISAQ